MMKTLIFCVIALIAPLSFGQVSTPSSKQIRLIFAGDTALDSDAGTLIRQGGDPFQHFAQLFRQADVRLLNLECVVATRGQAVDKHYTFRAHPRVLSVLKKHFDGVTLANNHSGDYGHTAFIEMLSLLQRHQLQYAGGGLHLTQAHTPWIVENNGIRLALLSYNEFMPRRYEAQHNAPGVAWSEDEQVMDDIRQARTVYRADVVLPFMHWGWENEPRANNRQRELARKMIDAGADAVIGGHPHVTQDIEIYQSKPIIYSVGNFVMKATDNAQQRRGWVLRLSIDSSGVTGFDTHVAQLNMSGIPRYIREAESPCWSKGGADIRACRPDSK